MTNLEYLCKNYKKFAGLTRQQVEDFVYCFGYTCPTHYNRPPMCHDCGSCIDLFLDSEYEIDDVYAEFWNQIALIEKERNTTKRQIEHNGMLYRCPTPTTSCEYYHKNNGLCGMVGERINPVNNCAIAHTDKEGKYWKPINITNIKRTGIVRRVSNNDGISMAIPSYLMEELNFANDEPLEVLILEDNIGKQYIAISPYESPYDE